MAFNLLPAKSAVALELPVCVRVLQAKSVDATLGYILKCGEVNLKAMRLLDQGHTSK